MNLKIVDCDSLNPYIEQLLALEKSIRYPIEDGQDFFNIVHGEKYHPFFSKMGLSRFLLALDNDKLIGCVAATWKYLQLPNSREVCSLYIADLKLSKTKRGLGIPAKMAWHALLQWIFKKEYRRWDFLFYAAMQGKGDVNRSFKGVHLGKLVRPVATFRIFFVELQKFPKSPAPDLSAYRNCICLSPQKENTVSWNNGYKDFILESTGRPWPLAHLPPIDPSIQPYFFDKAAEEIRTAHSDSIGCFAIDERLTDMINWLASENIHSQTQCVIYTLSFTGFSVSKHSDLLSISTAEI